MLSNCPYMGDIPNLQNNLFSFLCALSYCSNSEDFQFLLFDMLAQESEYIKVESDFVSGAIDIKITPGGWRKN